mgnify:FL=1
MSSLPPGARYLPDFISRQEEAAFAARLDGGAWSGELKRRVQHFGYRYDYKARAVRAAALLGPLPDWLHPLAGRLAQEGLFGAVPDQVIANEYLPGQGISAHVDCVPCFGAQIASLSLLSSCEMVFRHEGEVRALQLAPRSLLLLTGPARYDWRHEIPARKSDPGVSGRRPRGRRLSLTFRKVLARP